MTKRRLYYLVEKIRKDYGITDPPPYDAKALCTSVFGLHLDFFEIKTQKLRGMSHIPSRSIVIDPEKSEQEQNFYCMHEIMHHTVHKNRPTKSYSCYEETQANQDPFVEWEANEGAAQFLVPYQDFIPRFWCYLNAPRPPQNIQGLLAGYYHVSQQVINIRIDSLSYEIDQYKEGARLDCLELLSRRQRQKRGIITTSYGALCDFALDWDSAICAD